MFLDYGWKLGGYVYARNLTRAWLGLEQSRYNFYVS